MKRILLSISSLLLLTACVQVPMTTIQVPTDRGMVIIKAPKDSKIAGLKANFEKGTVSLDSYEARMNPEIISASAAGQVEVMRQYGEMAQMAMRMAAASQGIPLGGLTAQPQPNQTITTDQLNAIIDREGQKRAQQILAAQSTNPPPATLRGGRNRIIPPVSTNAPPTAPNP